MNFLKKEDGNVTVVLVVLLPVLLWCLFFFESKMQVRWIYTQVQSVLDFSTLAGANTGETQKSGTEYVCRLAYAVGTNEAGHPYSVSEQTKSGYHVAVKLFKENVKTLPEEIKNELLAQLQSGDIEGLKDRDAQMGGYMIMSTSFKYKPNIPIFFRNYVVTVSSTSRCQPDI